MKPKQVEMEMPDPEELLTSSQIEIDQNSTIFDPDRSKSWFCVLKFNIIASLLYILIRFLFVGASEENFVDAVYLLISVALPITYLLFKTPWTRNDVGLNISWKGMVLGVMFYLVCGLFFRSIHAVIWIWYDTSNLLFVWMILERIITLSCVDLWFHGFLFLPLSKKFGFWKATIVQTIYWFIFHLFEIFWLINYASIPIVILFILVTGFIGDIVAWKTKSVFGLMIGHILLNFLSPFMIV